MNILEFYLKQQTYKDWYDKFQSTAKNKSGKIFSYTSTNYRYMENFLKDLVKFKNNNGVSRNEWSRYSGTGQEVDKQRIIPLTYSGIIRKDIDKFYLTGIGYTCLDLIDAEYTSNEKWLLLYLILLGYRSEWRENDILETSKEYMNYLLQAGLKEEYICNELKELQKLSDIEDILKTDIFWYITFAKDKQFIEKYKKSTPDELTMLHSYVVNEQKKERSKDCIGHKFKAGGQMLPGSFLEECKTLYISFLLSKSKYDTIEEMVNTLIDIYRTIVTLEDNTNINNFVAGHKSVYDGIFKKSGLRSDVNE